MIPLGLQCDKQNNIILLKMLKQIYIDEHSKIITDFKPEIFRTLTILESKPYNQYAEYYTAYDQINNEYQIYRTEKDLEPILEEIEFFSNSPKILLIKTEKDHIIIEEKIQENLYEYLLASENKSVPSPYFSEPQAKRILLDLKSSLDKYNEQGKSYSAIHPKNIVRRGKSWQFSLVGLLLKNEKESPDFYKKDVKKEKRDAYALGTLLFKLIFGFVPFEKKQERANFSFKDYLKYLDREETKKSLKIYYFADRLLQISEGAKELIELSLRGELGLEEFYGHSYFSLDSHLGAKKEINPGNRQIKMLSQFGSAYQSLIMAALEHHRKYPQQRINSKLIYSFEFTKQEIISHLRKHPVLCEIDFHEKFKEEKVKDSLRVVKRSPQVHLEYFYKDEQFDPQTDYPCRQLIKLIQSSDEKEEAAIKLYAFPYAMIFELLKVSDGQPEDVIERIERVAEDLLQVSQLNRTKAVRPLHQTQVIISSFEGIKIKLRESLNALYKHFLNEAIKKYNIKKEVVNYSQRAKYKKMGLEYYRLCLKLMECSLLNRKGGNDLDLKRIQTSDRKQIENDLNQLLKQYFPNKIEPM